MSERQNFSPEREQPDLPSGTFISVTYVKLKDADPELHRQFMNVVGNVMKQARTAPGLIKRRLYADDKDPTVFYTMTAWQSQQAMQEFRDASAHEEAMQGRSALTSEGGIAAVNWLGDTTPSLEEIKERLGITGNDKTMHP